MVMDLGLFQADKRIEKFSLHPVITSGEQYNFNAAYSKTWAHHTHTHTRVEVTIPYCNVFFFLGGGGRQTASDGLILIMVLQFISAMLYYVRLPRFSPMFVGIYMYLVAFNWGSYSDDRC